MLVTEFGIVICCKELQPSKAYFPMLVTELGIVISCKELQPSKAFSPILVTEFGILICCKAQPTKAYFPMFVTILGMIKHLSVPKYEINLFPFLSINILSFTIKQSELLFIFKSTQLEKAPPKILVTELGMVICCKDSQL